MLGTLTCGELYGGLEWLGLRLTPAQVHSIVRSVDTSGDGLLTLNEFRARLSPR